MPNAVITGRAADRLGNVSDWSVNADATPHSPSDDTAAVGEVTVVAAPKSSDVLFVQGDELTLSADNIGSVNGNVNSVQQSGPLSISVTSGDAFFRYVAERDIPAVGSGSPVAAIDMCQQIINGRRLTYSSNEVWRDAMFWTLAGHDVGFDVNNEMLLPTNSDTIVLHDYSSAHDGSKMDARRLTNTQRNFTGYGYAQGGPTADLYCTAGIGSSWRANDYPAGLALSYDLLLPAPDDVHEFFIRTGGWGENVAWDTVGFRVTVSRTQMVVNWYETPSNSAPTKTFTDVFATVSDVDFDPTAEMRLGINLRAERYSTSSRDYVLRSDVQLYQTPADKFTGSAYGADVMGVASGYAAPPADNYGSPSRPFTLRGGLFRNLVMVDSKLITTVLPYYRVLPSSTQYDYKGLPDAMLTGIPIAGMTGTLWDYIKQIAGGLGVEFHADNDKVIRLVPVGSNVQPLPPYVASINRTVGDEDAALNVQLTNYETDLHDGPFVVYDARESGDTWTVGVNEVTTSYITIPNYPRIVQQPLPASTTRNQVRG